MRAASHGTWSIALVGLSLVVGLTGCASTQTVGEETSDGWITSKVTAKLAADPEVNPFDIDVDVLDGVVTLAGTVRDERTRRHAEELARQTKGVKGVENLLRVEG